MAGVLSSGLAWADKPAPAPRPAEASPAAPPVLVPFASAESIARLDRSAAKRQSGAFACGASICAGDAGLDWLK